MQITCKRFTTICRNIRKNRGLFNMTDVIDDFYKRLPDHPGHLLDLGCGAGEPFPAFLFGRAGRLPGLIFFQNAGFGNHYQPAMNTIFADICTIDLAERQFDAVTSIYCLFHIEYEKHRVIFPEIYRWLKPGGLALFTYATKEYTGAHIFNGYKEFMGENLFYSHTTPESMTATLKSAGFKTESLQYRNIGGETFLWVTISKPVIL